MCVCAAAVHLLPVVVIAAWWTRVVPTVTHSRCPPPILMHYVCIVQFVRIVTESEATVVITSSVRSRLYSGGASKSRHAYGLALVSLWHRQDECPATYQWYHWPLD